MDRVGVTGFGWEMEIKIPAFAGMTGMGRGAWVVVRFLCLPPSEFLLPPPSMPNAVNCSGDGSYTACY